MSSCVQLADVLTARPVVTTKSPSVVESSGLRSGKLASKMEPGGRTPNKSTIHRLLHRGKSKPAAPNWSSGASLPLTESSRATVGTAGESLPILANTPVLPTPTDTASVVQATHRQETRARNMQDSLTISDKLSWISRE